MGYLFLGCMVIIVLLCPSAFHFYIWVGEKRREKRNRTLPRQITISDLRIGELYVVHDVYDDQHRGAGLLLIGRENGSRFYLSPVVRSSVLVSNRVGRRIVKEDGYERVSREQLILFKSESKYPTVIFERIIK